jgi:hypothetical protein
LSAAEGQARAMRKFALISQGNKGAENREQAMKEKFWVQSSQLVNKIKLRYCQYDTYQDIISQYIVTVSIRSPITNIYTIHLKAMLHYSAITFPY